MNVIELTHKSNFPYPVSIPMDDKDKEEKGKEEELAAAKKEEERKKAEKAWEELNREREAKGEKITPLEKSKQRILIVKGILPKAITAIFSDFKLEIAPKEPAKPEALEKLKAEAEKFIGAGSITKKDIKAAQEEVDALKAEGKIDDKQAEWLDREIQDEVAHHEKQNKESVEMGEEKFNKAEEAMPKRIRKEPLTEEEKVVTDEYIERGLMVAKGGADAPPIEGEKKTYTAEEVAELINALGGKKGSDESEYEKLQNYRKKQTETFRKKAKTEEMRQVYEELWAQKGLNERIDSGLPIDKDFSDRNTDMAAARSVDGPPGEYNSDGIAVLDEFVTRLKGKLRSEIEDDPEKSLVRQQIRGLIAGTVGARRYGDEDAKLAAIAKYEKLIEEVLAKTVGDSPGDFYNVFRTEILKPVYNAVDNAAKEGRGLDPYGSITEIARDIMLMSGGDFARDGKYALLKIEKGVEVFQEANFLEWVRNRLIYYHETDVDNPVDMFQRIAISGGARNVSIMEMLDNQAMFSLDGGKYLETLRDQVLYEVWLFNTSRDISAIYRKVRGDDEKLPETLAEIYRRNTFTKAGTLDRVLTLPDAQSGVDFSSKDSMRQNQRAGHAVRRALNIYYNIADYDMVKRITGSEKSILLDNKAFMEAYLRLKAKGRSEFKTLEEYKKHRRDVIYNGLEKIQYTEKFFNSGDRAFQLYLDELRYDSVAGDKYDKLIKKIEDDIHKYETGSGNGTLAARKKNIDPKENPRSRFKEPTEAEARAAGMKLEAYREKKLIEAARRYDYMEAINLFNASMKDIGLMADTQEKIRLFILEQSKQKVIEKIDGKDVEVEKIISWDDAYYAETFANTMMHWGGGAAKNDTSSVGFDSWTKVLATEPYRLRQTAANRGGVHGNIYNFPGYKQLGVDFFVGVVDVNGKSILEIIQGGQGDDITNIDKNIDEIRFGDDTMNHFASDHITRTFKLFHNIVETHEYNFDQFLTVDSWGQLVFDPTKANEVMDGMFKAFRYPYNTWTGLDFSKLVVRQNTVTGEFETKTMGEVMFGEEIYRDFVNEKRMDKEHPENRTKSVGQIIQENRGEFYKRPIMYSIAAELRAHRIYGGGYRKYKTAQLEAIYKFLETFAGDLEYNSGDIKDIRRSKVKRFFTKEDIKWIRMHSGTGVWAVYFSEYAGETLSGVWEGFMKGLGIFFGSLDKV
ncbi:MAG TPA: hypothetical protein VG917_06010 [Patescibacteria group bacterium]|nr:hypothetical protein [Patescibacteria group bacterium]